MKAFKLFYKKGDLNMEITRRVKMYGTTWVVVLDPQSREMLGITEVGQTVSVRKVDEPADDATSY